MRHLVGRFWWSLVVVWGVISITFVVNDLLPGDPARMAAGPQARPADVARIRDQLGLNRPPLVRYGLFWSRLVHLGPRDRGSDPAHASCLVVVPLGVHALHVDLGKSFQMRQPVVDLVGTRMGRTFVLALAGVSLQLLLGAAMGVLAALRRGSWVDRVVVGTSVLGTSVPTFVVGLVLQYLFAYELRWLPLDGYGTNAVEHARCLILPALTLGIYGSGYYTRIIRDEVLTALRADWTRTARAKGSSLERAVVFHALRNAVVPIVTAVGLDLGALLGGAVVTETVFRWPGLGDLGVRATLNRDGPVVVACVIVTSVAVVASNALADVLGSILDPRL